MLSVHSCTNGDPKEGGLAGRLSKPGSSLGEGNERQLEGLEAFEKKRNPPAKRPERCASNDPLTRFP